MATQKELFKDMKKKWEEEIKSSSTRDYNFDTLSGEKIDSLYLPDNPEEQYLEKLGFPGQFPYTRGVHANMYRGKLWTKRQFSGFGTPEETNARYHSLLSKGQTGLSVAYDMPTLMGYDPDHPWARGEVGKCGVVKALVKSLVGPSEGLARI